MNFTSTPSLKKWILPLLIGGNLLACVNGKPSQNQPLPVTFSGPSGRIQQAFVDAKKDGKYILLDFYADWCGPCKVIESLLKDPKTIAILEKHFVLLKINDKDPDAQQLRELYSVPGYPSLIVLNKDGERLYNLAGLNSAKIQEGKNLQERLLDIANGSLRLDQMLAQWKNRKKDQNSANLAFAILSEYVVQQDAASAEQWISQIFKEDNSNNSNGYKVQALFKIGFDLYQNGLGDEEKAVIFFRRIRKEFASSDFAGPAVEEEAKILWKRGERESVESVFADLRNRAPENVSVPIFYASFCLKHQWHLEDAKRVLEEQLKKDPSNKDLQDWLKRFF